MSKQAKKTDDTPIDDALAEATLTAMRTEFALRRERKKQSREGGLIEFVRYFWNIIEPETKLVEGWVLYAICEHLEAVTLRENHPAADQCAARINEIPDGERVLARLGVGRRWACRICAT